MFPMFVSLLVMYACSFAAFDVFGHPGKISALLCLFYLAYWTIAALSLRATARNVRLSYFIVLPSALLLYWPMSVSLFSSYGEIINSVLGSSHTIVEGHSFMSVRTSSMLLCSFLLVALKLSVKTRIPYVALVVLGSFIGSIYELTFMAYLIFSWSISRLV